VNLMLVVVVVVDTTTWINILAHVPLAAKAV
jgi:hypothetical protein